MQPTKSNIMSIFEKGRRYLVPIFQRPYVWGKDNQWYPLWGDIHDKAEIVLNRDQRDSSPIRNHFLGAIVLSFHNPSRFNPHIPADEIIDGQQRLTTMQILLIALRDFVTKYPFRKYPETLIKLTYNDLAEVEIEEYKVWPSISDRTVYQKIYEAGSFEAVKNSFPLIRYYKSRYYKPRPRLVDAYLFFYEKIVEYISQDDNGDKITLGDNLSDLQLMRLAALIDAVTQYIEIVIIELESDDDPQIIFEALNDHREPLLPSDLIRNFVFLNAQSTGKSVEDIHKKYWNDYDDYERGSAEFWKAEESRGRRINKRFDLFIFNFLIVQTLKEILLPNLYQEFREWWADSSSRDVEVELKNLQTYAGLFKKLYYHEDGTSLGSFTRRLRELDTTTIYPLVLYLLAQDEARLPVVERELIFKYLESFLIRRAVCGLTPKNYNRFFLSMLKNVSDEKIITASWFDSYLKRQTELTSKWPMDEEFETAWQNRPVYQSGTYLPRLVLNAINQKMTTEKDIEVIKSAISVEHIMPQNLDAPGWKLQFPPDADELTRIRAIDNRRRIIHTLGNLTLVTQPLNSAMRDADFETKRTEILKHISIKLNTYFVTMSDPLSWSESDIEKRGKELFKYAAKIWQR